MTLRLDLAPPLARLLIDRPAKRNAMTTAMFEALPALVARAESAKALVLTSATPGLFCAGADIAELSANAHDPAWRAGRGRGSRRR